MDIFDLYQKFKECNQNISTDTRSITSGSIFFAWKGESHDGNQFAKEALEKGARYAVIDNPDYAVGDQYIVVNSGMKALQQLARYHRQQFHIPVIAIGGSNGKTTTKELIARILGTQKDVVASLRSENNHVGVPKTLLRMTNLTDIVVVEMGANHIGEIAELTKITEPTHGLITNIGRDHIGFFGGQGAIIEANIELYTYLKQTDGYVFINKNNMTLMKYIHEIDHTCYGEGLNGEFGVDSNKTAPYISFSWKHHTIQTKITGEYNIENIITAIAVGVHFGITDENIIKAIESYIPTNNRSEIIETEKENIVIKDFYNANRTSMEASLKNLKEISEKFPNKKSIAILGDMLELGEFSIGEHQATVDLAQSLSIDEIIIIGPDFKQTNHEGITSYVDVYEAINNLQGNSFENSNILLKASNGTNFKKLFNELEW